MKAFPWLVACTGIGVAAYIVLTGPRSQFRQHDDLEAAAGRSKLWGARQGLAGSGTEFIGNLKESVGGVIGDDSLVNKGTTDRIVGTVRKSAGKAAAVVGDSLHNLNS